MGVLEVVWVDLPPWTPFNGSAHEGVRPVFGSPGDPSRLQSGGVFVFATTGELP